MPLRPPCLRPHSLSITQSRHFHPTRRKPQRASLPNHYDTLALTPTASASEIKKQFYSLSKKWHPDLNHTDPSASAKFVKISEAYHVLGSTEKRGLYDKEYARAHNRKGSHSSAGARGPVGARPASGLSKRRSPFRGPPASFYTQGGYGTGVQSGKRAKTAEDAARKARENPGGLGSQPEFEGTGGYETYYEPDLPYFDKESHRRTHDNLGARSEKSKQAFVYPSEYAMGGSMWFNFLLVTGVVSMAVGIATFVVHGLRDAGRPKRSKDKEKG